MDKVIKTFQGLIKSIDKEKHEVTVVVSDATIDRDKEVIEPDGWVLDNYKKHPVLLDNHSIIGGVQKILGKAIDVQVINNKLVATFKYFVGQGNALADYAWSLVEQGLAAFSVSFLPIEWKDGDGSDGVRRRYVKQELLEISQVTVPANPNAVLNAVEMGDKDMIAAVVKAFDIIKSDIHEKGVIGYNKAPWLPDDTKWDAARARRDAYNYAKKDDGSIDVAKFKKFFLWFDSEKPGNRTSYKLPFRYLSNGQPHNVWRGVVAAMAALLGARGGVDIPESDRRKVYDVLAKYYREKGKEPPDFKDYEGEVEIFAALGCKNLNDALQLNSDVEQILEVDETEKGTSPANDSGLPVLIELYKHYQNKERG